MVFSSVTFLFYFLPIVLIAYFISPKRLRNAILAVSSLLFYAWGEPRYIVIMLFSTALDYTCGLMIARARRRGGTGKGFLLVSMVGNLSVLGFFKYYNFLAGSVLALVGVQGLPVFDVALPIGISFYTFQTMSYTIDVYRGKVAAQRNLINFATFVTLFPQLIAGPIVKYTDIAQELDDTGRGSVDLFAEGVSRFIAGLAKKVLLANNIGLLWDTLRETPIGQMSALGAWLGIIAYTFQIYFDFSGYSDMAIGLGKMFGFRFPENFNYPYISRSITEFWRRWHMTLSGWFREYVYIPLGGNRRGLGIQLRNILIVWLLTGLWHGASWNFLAWGLYYGVILLLEKLFLLKFLTRCPRVVQHIYTMLLVVLGWVLFAFDELARGAQYLGMMFGVGVPLVNDQSLFSLLSYLPMLVILILGATPLPKRLLEAPRLRPAVRMLMPALAVAALLLCTAYLVESGYNPFLYFRF